MFLSHLLFKAVALKVRFHSNISITWELVRNANAWAPHTLVELESESLKEGEAQHLCLNTTSGDPDGHQGLWLGAVGQEDFTEILSISSMYYVLYFIS